LSSAQKFNTPLQQATTASLEALQAYNFGLNTDDDAAALAFFQRATQLDPNFAMAYWALAGSTSDAALSAESARKAFELRAGLSERERLLIEADYYWNGTGDLLKAQRSAEVGVQTYPRDPDFHWSLRMYTVALGQYEASLKESLELLHLSPPNSLHYRVLAFSYLYLNRVEDAEATAKEAHAYLAAHQGQEAAVEFQKILDHRGIVLNEPIGALAHLQLGRAYAMQGDTAKSRTAYQDFLTLWKDADPDIPILIAAKAESAKLK
jgi:tetratricopeptide (TPR) repeat protein